MKEKRAGNVGQPVPASGDTRSSYSDLVSVYLPVALGVFAIVAIALTVVALRYRARPGRTPSPIKEHHRIEGGYVVLLAIITGLLVWQTFAAVDDVEPLAAAQSRSDPGPAPELTVAITASRWNWRFTYPGGVVQTGDRGKKVATLVVPADEPVRFRLRSTDVVHAFWLPELRVKYDALPSRTNVFDVRFPADVDYSAARCSEFCGQFHDQMELEVDVLPPAEFERWLEARRTESSR